MIPQFWTTLASVSGYLLRACWIAEAAVQQATDAAMGLDALAQTRCAEADEAGGVV